MESDEQELLHILNQAAGHLELLCGIVEESNDAQWAVQPRKFVDRLDTFITKRTNQATKDLGKRS